MRLTGRWPGERQGEGLPAYLPEKTQNYQEPRVCPLAADNRECLGTTTVSKKLGAVFNHRLSAD